MKTGKYEGHTPGPWRIGDAGNTVFGPPNGKPSPATVARMPQTMQTGRKRADAALIADAPALLAQRDALAAALATMLGAAETDCLDDKSNVWRSAMLDARAALAALED